MGPPTRNVWLKIWENFVKSIETTPKHHLGELKGEDYLGNKYFEVPADPRGGRRRPSRWFESKTGDIMQQVPPEWGSWLGNRRDEIPSEEEIVRNLASSQIKKDSAQKLYDRLYKQGMNINEGHSNRNTTSRKTGSFPNYGDEFEYTAGEHKFRKT